MKTLPHISLGNSSKKTDIIARWDNMAYMERLKLIMDNANLFWVMRLITRSEIEMVMTMHESAREYIVNRENHPLFTSIDLKGDINDQASQLHRDKLTAVLRMVFY